ncbi:hypothetical protein BJX99DRAFT_257917 [Aspergillus californicus]
MSEKFFFDSWVGKTIKLGTTNPPSAWKLVTKLSDKHLQIPYGGSEYAIHGERAQQATVIPNGTTREELAVVDLLRKNGCTAAPGVRTQETTLQMIAGSFQTKERDHIREAYKAAWR